MTLEGASRAVAPDVDGELTEALSTVRVLSDSRARSRSGEARGDRGVGMTLGLGVHLAAVLLALAAGRPSGSELVALGGLAALYLMAYRTEIVLPGGGALPTQPVLVGLLLAGPAALTPLAVLVGVHLAELAALPPGTGLRSAVRTLVPRANAVWSSVAPAVVLTAAGSPRAAAGLLPLYLVAFLAQVVLDWVVALVCAAPLGVRPLRVLPSLLWTLGVDLCLAPLGLCVVLAADGHLAPLLVLAAPVVLVRLMAQDRTQQLHTAVALGAAFDAAHEEARVDALTGLLNRRAWAERLDDCARAGRPVGVLVADADGLKHLNDTQGHAAGDELLRAVAGILREHAPEGSLVARLGGDEFGILVTDPATGPADGPTGDRLVRALRAAMAAHPGVAGAPVSTSLGWACAPPATDPWAAADRADALAATDKLRRRAGRATVGPPRAPAGDVRPGQPAAGQAPVRQAGPGPSGTVGGG